MTKYTRFDKPNNGSKKQEPNTRVKNKNQITKTKKGLILKLKSQSFPGLRRVSICSIDLPGFHKPNNESKKQEPNTRVKNKNQKTRTK